MPQYSIVLNKHFFSPITLAVVASNSVRQILLNITQPLCPYPRVLLMSTYEGMHTCKYCNNMVFEKEIIYIFKYHT